MNPQKEKLIYDTYQSFIDQCLGRKIPDALNEILSEDAMGFGTAADEKIFGIEDFLKLIKIQKEQSEGLNMKWEIDPVSRYVNAEENLAVFADDLHLNVAVNGEKIKMYVRISVVLEYKNNRWIVIHWHGSKPEEVQSEEDTFGIENWKQKVEKLEKIVAQRTADLVEKNRELEIEAALERIRARAMSMQHSEELADTASVLFQQIKGLGFETWSCGFCTWKENDMVEVWMGADSGGLLPPMMIPYKKEPTHHDIYKASLTGADVHERIWEGKSLEKHYNFLRTLPSVAVAIKKLEDAGLSLPTKQCYYVGFFKQGYLLLITKELIEEMTDISKRFAKVFEQAYTRFLDLQKAEAQSRESQIEAALEKIRSRSLAMHKSDELKGVISIVFEKMKELDVLMGTVAIWQFDKETKNSFFWLWNELHVEPTLVYLPNNDKLLNKDGCLKDAWQAYLSGENLINKRYSFEIKNEYFDYVFANNDFTAIPQEPRNFIMQAQNLIVCLLVEKNSALFADSWNGQSYSEEKLAILKRVAKVFEQAYVRFLDLQKAEAQAMQAEKSLIEIKLARQKAEEALSHLKAAQKQLVQSEKMASLGELTAGIAHEIQNPLNFVNNFSEVSNELIDEMNEELEKGDIEEAKALAADVKQNLIKINHHGNRAGDIVKGMLLHSRSSTGVKEPTDINALADEYLRLSYHGLRAKDKDFNADFKTEYDESIGKINIIPQDVGRVLLNLYNNAFYAVQHRQMELTKEVTPFEKVLPLYQPTVSVQTRRINDNIEISVTDNGNGIPQNIVDKIFQPFFTTKPAGQGTGLGLSLSYDIVKAQDGKIKVNTKEGEGSEFIIQLPVA